MTSTITQLQGERGISLNTISPNFLPQVGSLFSLWWVSGKVDRTEYQLLDPAICRRRCCTHRLWNKFRPEHHSCVNTKPKITDSDKQSWYHSKTPGARSQDRFGVHALGKTLLRIYFSLPWASLSLKDNSLPAHSFSHADFFKASAQARLELKAVRLTKRCIAS